MTGTHYKCHICGKNFRALYAMLFHLKNEHCIDIEKYIWSCGDYDFTEAKCSICGRLRSMDATGRFIAKTCGSSECVTKQTQQTILKTHGTTSWTASNEFKTKAAQTKLNKYGHSNYRDLKTYTANCMQKYGFPNERYRVVWNMIQGWSQYIIPMFDRTEYKGLFHTYKWKCQLCGNEFVSTIHTTRHVNGHEYDRMPRCFDCFPRIHGTSQQENEFIEFCKTFYPNLETHNKTLIGKELDVVIPELKLAIEYNGLYWHSTMYPKYKPRNHIIKTTLCEDIGYRLIYVWENNWIENNELIKTKLRDVFTNNETIPEQDKYDRCWYSPTQFPNQTMIIEPPELKSIDFGGKTFIVENCGYLTTPPLQ